MAVESDAALREAAAEWFARMRGPNADRERAAFDAWIAEDPGHKRLYDQMQVAWERSRLVTHTPAGQAYAGLPARAAALRGPWLYAIAASIAAIFVVTLVFAYRGPIALPGVPVQEVASQIGIRQVRLGDGSILTLDAGTRIELRFAAGERRVVLKTGRARFDVRQDKARPFVVAAAEREIVATGTLFDVTCIDGKLTVALLRGNVEVRNARPDAQRMLVAHLEPGQEIQLAPGMSGAPHPMDAGGRDWPRGMVEFDGAPLSTVVAVANRYAKRRIVLVDPATGSLRVTGAYKMGDPEALAATLAVAFDLTVAPGQDGSILLARRR
jgi:transmembrane sensor